VAVTGEGPTLDKQAWLVAPASYRQAVAMVQAHHYSQSAANTATACHGLYRRADHALMGVALWIPPTKGAAAATCPGDWQGVLTLSRLALLPDVPKNGASFLLARSVQLLDARWTHLVTYADTWRGHTGAIYRATNWRYRGLTTPEAVFVDGEGRMRGRKRGPMTLTRAQMAERGLTFPGRFAKHKFDLRRGCDCPDLDADGQPLPTPAPRRPPQRQAGAVPCLQQAALF
jgi:hypothetical protein